MNNESTLLRRFRDPQLQSLLRPCFPIHGTRAAILLLTLSSILLSSPVAAQMSLASTINLALSNSPQVKMAEDDVRRSSAVLSETKDVYVPTLNANGGAGTSYGITLTVPTIFTANAQSLVFNYSQHNFLRSAHLGLKASLLALEDTRAAIEEDTAVTYVILDHAQETVRTLTEQYNFALRLVDIVQQRRNAGLESQLELELSRRTVLQLKLHILETENGMAFLREHLGQLTGVSASQFVTVSESIPLIPESALTDGVPTIPLPDSPSLLSAEANAKSRQERALGDARYTWRPQVTFFAQYGRISPINDVSDYYNLHGKYNTAAVGLQVQIPILDASHKARAQQSMQDALHAAHEVTLLRGHQSEDRLRVMHTLSELTLKKDIAVVEQAIAQEQLNAMLIQLKTGGYGGRTMTPKDEQNARIFERQRHVELLDATLQLRKAEIFLLRHRGELEQWLQSRDSTKEASPLPLKPEGEQ